MPSIETGCAVRVADPDCLGPLSSGARNADLPPEHRCSIRLASVLPVGRMGAVFLNANGSKRPGNGVTLPFFVPRPTAMRNREKTYTVFAIAHAGALDLIRTAMEAYVIGLPAWPPPLQS